MRTAFCGVVICVAPATGTACGACTWAMLWDFFPPSLWWIWIGCVLYLVTAIMQRFQETKYPLTSGPVEAIMFIIVAVIVSMFPFGPLMAAGLAALAIYSACRMWIPSRKKAATGAEKAEPQRVNRPLAIVHIVAAAGLIASAVFTFVQRARSDTADKIMAFPGTTWGRKWERKLEQEEPASFPQYRKLITRGDSASAGRATQRLLSVSKEESDIEFVLKAVERFRKKDGGWGEDYQLQGALRAKTGLKLEDATAQKWRAAIKSANTTGTADPL